jgi:hypothetical protein
MHPGADDRKARIVSGLGAVVVGYRHDARRLVRLKELYGLQAIRVGRCIGACGYDVFFYSGGVDAVRERDAQVICEQCKTHYHGEILAEL